MMSILYNEEAEKQRIEITCPKLHSQWWSPHLNPVSLHKTNEILTTMLPNNVVAANNKDDNNKSNNGNKH